MSPRDLISLAPLLVLWLAAPLPTLASAPASPVATASRAPACPARSFERFLAAFERSVATQRAFTKVPLGMRHRDRVAEKPDGDPVFVEQELEAGAVSFPVFPDSRARTKAGRRMEIVKPAPGCAEVRVWQEDSDWVVVYRFEQAACWRLVFVDDRSL